MKYLLFFMMAFAVMSCKNESETSAESNDNQNQVSEHTADGLSTITGNFVYYADAAVMEVNDKMFGVILNDKMNELNKMAQPYKEQPTDYVKVEIRGELVEKPSDEEGWPYTIDIKEIISVQKAIEEDDIITIEE